MSLRVIQAEKGFSDNLPWVKEYIETVGEPNDSYPVDKIVISGKGALVITCRFKGFLFDGSSILKFLTQALAVWVTNETFNPLLFAIATQDGKINLAIDDASQSVVWTKTGNTFEQKKPEDTNSLSTGETSNPFLVTSPTVSKSKRKA